MTKKTYLSARQQFETTKYLQDHYVTSGLKDADFAKQASEDLGFEVKLSHIYGIRKNFEITANQQAKAVNGKPTMALLIEVESRLRMLEDRVEVYFKGCRK